MAEKKFTDELDRLSYALGLSTASNFLKLGDNSFNHEVFLKAIKDVCSGEIPEIMLEKANKNIDEFMKEANANLAETNLSESKELLDQNGYKDYIAVINFGFQYNIIKKGKGPKPLLTDKIKCHYQGSFIDETGFDSSVERGSPSALSAYRVIKGMAGALQMMQVGSALGLFISPFLANRRKGAGIAIGLN